MSYIVNNPGIMLGLLWEHIVLALTALVIATIIAVPVGFVIHTRPRLQTAVLGVFGALYTIPSLVLMILLLPLFGLNQRTVIVALIIYNQIILVRNVVAALKGVDPALLQAATAMGMTPLQRFRRVQLPLALPIVIAGIRVAAVVSTAIATIGALFGAGGLGTLLFNGIAQNRFDKIVAGSITVAALALVINYGLQYLENRIDVVARSRRKATAPRGAAA